MNGVYSICAGTGEALMDKAALIETFIVQWGYPDPVANEYFRLELRKLISELCPEILREESKVPDHSFDTYPIPRRIILEEED